MDPLNSFKMTSVVIQFLQTMMFNELTTFKNKAYKLGIILALVLYPSSLSN